jgi:polyketide synthase PksN
MATATSALPRRVSLPTYPFARERYWIPNPTSEHTKPNPDVQRELIDAQTQLARQEMDELLCKCLWSQLQLLGLFREKHAVLVNLREQAGISTSYDRWLQVSVDILEQKKYLNCQEASLSEECTTCVVLDPTLIESAPLWQDWDQHKVRWMQNGDLKARVVLVEAMLRALPAILTGKRLATEIMFPNGSMELVEGIYQHNRVSDYLNEVLATRLLTYLQERLAYDRHTRIRVLEIGAGTGGTSSRVLQKLQPYQAAIAEYCYSDISKAFLLYAQKMYGVEYPYLNCRLLDVE